MALLNLGGNVVLRFSEEWLNANNRDKEGKLLKRGKARQKDPVPDITRGLKGPARKLLKELEQSLAPSPHAQQLIKLNNDPDYARRKGPEHRAQVTYFDYMYRHHRDIYELVHATPNGGLRTDLIGFEMKAEGQKKGYPDVSLDAARGIYHGLRMELKVGKNTLQDSQKLWRDLLVREGYAWVEVRSWEGMVEVTQRYWLLKSGESMLS